ncbi:MAG: DNA-3-methyladenine glycosylase 2 family protein [Kordiimonadaceae bacterium]|nr:DNA-3-methyladenine glycosylase 2 family protein [Kordiimonadaceae bacterium]MBO6568843.1 DNA-3-methyladenine glycosylase 2 family protein [Kordiimonadaceae bacterium]MBO6965182.1 DNA-3-methyladenine glycosylase 2 family protein [Kordiimonadaceae bacterium]
MKNFQLRNSHIREQLTELAAKDAQVKAALDTVGFPPERVRDQSFAIFLRVIVGQQLSVKAAASIYGRIEDLVGADMGPSAFDDVDDDTLRGLGLSKQKIAYTRSLCETVCNGTLNIEKLPHQSDEDAIASIIAVKGLGVWSAHMYLLSSLGRPDIWPVGDLAVRVGVGRIIELEERPTEKETQEIGERWRPYRSAMALLAWHYYSNAPF